jgi:hypothetical protein
MTLVTCPHCGFEGAHPGTGECSDMAECRERLKDSINDAIEAAAMRGARTKDERGRTLPLIVLIGNIMHDYIGKAAVARDALDLNATLLTDLKQFKKERDAERSALNMVNFWLDEFAAQGNPTPDDIAKASKLQGDVLRKKLAEARAEVERLRGAHEKAQDELGKLDAELIVLKATLRTVALDPAGYAKVCPKPEGWEP